MNPVGHQEILKSLIDELKNEIGEETLRDWFSGASIAYNDGYILAFPNQFICEWVKNKYAKNISTAASKIGITLKIEIAKDDGLTYTSKETASTTPVITKTSKFNENFTFDNFVVGKSNEMAYEAALRIAKSKEIAFNPLFLYADVGLGKTHLMHAIANHREKHFPKQKIIYLSAEQFMNTFIKAIQQKTVLDFKDQFRSVDLLLIDDFQFLGSKEATQEEFFHTFNTLLENKKQLVISADKAPASLPGVEARLKSRLGWGLVVDIHPATYELKLGILKTKAQLMKIEVDEHVLSYIAEKVNTSIRELEGAFMRVTKYAEWTNTPITIELTEKMLQNISDSNKPKSPSNILNYVCKYSEITLEEIQSATRTSKIARARQKAVFLIRKHTGISYIQIAKLLGNKDHSSIIYAENQAKKLLKEESEFESDIATIEKQLKLGQ